MIYVVIHPVRRQLQTSGFPFETWTTREIRRICGISYQQIYRLERRGLIDKLTRGPNGYIAATPREVWIMLWLCECYLLSNKNRGQKIWPV